MIRSHASRSVLDAADNAAWDEARKQNRTSDEAIKLSIDRLSTSYISAIDVKCESVPTFGTKAELIAGTVSGGPFYID